MVLGWRHGGAVRAMGVTFEQVRKMALALDNAAEGTSYGTAAFKVGGKLFARLKEDGESLVVGTTFEERAEMMAAEPETYYITDHYLNTGGVLSAVAAGASDTLARSAQEGCATGSGRHQRRKPRERTNIDMGGCG